MEGPLQLQVEGSDNKLLSNQILRVALTGPVVPACLVGLKQKYKIQSSESKYGS